MLKTEFLILRTNLKGRSKVNVVRQAIDQHPLIGHWSVDTQDIDNVLRIEPKLGLSIDDVTALLREHGFYGENLEN